MTTESGEVRVYMGHIRKARMCARGARAFFERHNLDWADFLRNGIEPEKLVATGDAMALDVVEVAYGRKQ